MRELRYCTTAPLSFPPGPASSRFPHLFSSPKVNSKLFPGSHTLFSLGRVVLPPDSSHSFPNNETRRPSTTDPISILITFRRESRQPLSKSHEESPRVNRAQSATSQKLAFDRQLKNNFPVRKSDCIPGVQLLRRRRNTASVCGQPRRNHLGSYDFDSSLQISITVRHGLSLSLASKPRLAFVSKTTFTSPTWFPGKDTTTLLVRLYDRHHPNNPGFDC